MPLPIQLAEQIEPMQLDIPIEDNDSSEAIVPMNTEACNGDLNSSYKVENSTLDIEAYAANYNGINKIYRLLFVADHSTNLKVEALKIALNYIKEHTHNTGMYSKVYVKLAEALEKQNENVENIIGPIDNQWIEQRSKKASNLLEKLETDLKCYKSNSIKESIRRGHDDLGDHFLSMGDLNSALKCYIRSRDYCTNNKHVLNMCLNTIRISIYLKNWNCVTSHVVKAENNPDFANSEAAKTKVNWASGLANLANKKYHLAAKNFLQCNFDHFNNDSSEILSVNNIASYGTLCAMASFTRENLFRLVISSSSFKIFLETEPQLREALNKFYDSKYANCLSILDELKDNFLLDLYLAPHIKVLYSSIRNRALIQYFSPYISAKMDKMAIAFNTTVKSLEDEIMKLILDGQIQARIDSHNKVLYAKDIDPRTVTFEKALTIGKECQLRTKALLLRSAILKHGQIQVKNYSNNSKMDENMMSN